ncbi:cell wall protein RBR3-like [Salvia divinorum]|uniref:Cell wall protein RBR3-like n=1 Tax=Salvia divinorum TaxID=28513 RepID=A0ABD1G3T5_SALDI
MESEQAKGIIEHEHVRNASESEQVKGTIEHEHVGNASESEQAKGTIEHEHVGNTSESEQAKGTIEHEQVGNAFESEQAKGATESEQVKGTIEHEHLGNVSESEQVKGTIEHIRNVSESEQENSQIIEEAKARHLTPSSSASSSSSSCASLERDVPIAKSKSYGDLQPDQGSVSTPNCPAQTPEWSMASVSPIVHLSPTTSPPVQTMGQPSDYDPGRIPSSVFSSKPANTSDWSVASNDSLFSIHGGNTSFAKDQFRSEDLARLEEPSNGQSSLYASEAKPNEICSLPISLPPLIEVPSHEEGSVKSSTVSSLEKEDSITSETMKGGATTPRLSNESGTSSAFPALGSEGGKASSLEKVEEKPEMEAHHTNSTNPGSKKGRWFSWCPCFSRCC